MDENCGTCRFSRCFTDSRVSGGDCLRFPPKPGAMREWPGIKRDDWCGEYERKAEVSSDDEAYVPNENTVRISAETWRQFNGSRRY